MSEERPCSVGAYVHVDGDQLNQIRVRVADDGYPIIEIGEVTIYPDRVAVLDLRCKLDDYLAERFKAAK